MGETTQGESRAEESLGGTLAIFKFRGRREGKDHEKETPSL